MWNRNFSAWRSRAPDDKWRSGASRLFCRRLHRLPEGWHGNSGRSSPSWRLPGARDFRGRWRIAPPWRPLAAPPSACWSHSSCARPDGSSHRVPPPAHGSPPGLAGHALSPGDAFRCFRGRKHRSPPCESVRVPQRRWPPRYGTAGKADELPVPRPKAPRIGATLSSVFPHEPPVDCRQTRLAG